MYFAVFWPFGWRLCAFKVGSIGVFEEKIFDARASIQLLKRYRKDFLNLAHLKITVNLYSVYRIFLPRFWSSFLKICSAWYLEEMM